MVARLQKSVESLHEMGHPEYNEDYSYLLECCEVLEKIELKVKKTEQKAKEWSDCAAVNRVQYKWLSFLPTHGIIEIYKLIQSSKKQSKQDIAYKIFKQLRFLMLESQSSYMEYFETAIKSISSKESSTGVVGLSLGSISSQETPTGVVGLYLYEVFKSVVISKPIEKDFRSFAVLHQCHKFTVKHLIQGLYSINSQFPKCYELLRCHSGTTLNDIQLFFQRIEFFPRHYYFLQVDQLNSKLQESLVQYYLELYDKMLKCDTHARSTLHFIETSASLLQNAPFINTVVKNEENLQKVDISFWSQPQLVYGLQGNGKTHYIRSQLTANNVVFAVNEMFFVGKVIDKLKLLCDEKNCSIFFNFTLLPPGKSVAEEERKEFETLMDKIGWFMFEFLVLGYIQDPHTGASFSVPLTENWKIFIEVPSLHNDPQSNLNTFKELLPTFNFIGAPKHISSSWPYKVDDDVQLVCKYLKAYKAEQENPGTREGINKLFNDFIQIPVKFSTEADFDESECLSLLDKYMPDYIAERKISQKLFIKYIKRRCYFLDNLPQYNYNAGRSLDGSDTRKLGSTLMNAMLNEVPQFCDPSTKEDWSIQAHQQLIYEGVGSIGLITLYPDQISSEDRKSFTNIGVKILSQGDFYKRKVLDEYLARALTLPLSEVTEVIYTPKGKGLPIEETQYKTLKLIDDSDYVLTLDFALKMINIHERRECGMPVIIEGETGVGKTALLRMLSKLWNYSYETELKFYEQKLKETLTLHHKRQNRLDMSLKQQLSRFRNDVESEEIFTTGGNIEAAELKRIILELEKIALAMKKNPSLSVVLPRHDTEEKFWRIANTSDDNIDTKDLLKLLDGFATAEISTFHKLDVHAGLKTYDIINFFNRVNEQAKRICIHFKDCVDKSQIPQVTAYLDEINTSSCMGLFKEIIIDRTIDGEAILDNVFIIAACNPLRGDSTIHLQNVKNVWVKPSYYVRELHPTIDYLKWDYGALNKIQEKEYITAKMNDCTKDQPDAFTSDQLTELILESQVRMRLYANTLLTNKGVHVMEARKCSRSCVSQRDIQRVFDFYKWSP
ncbi:PREDICTED: uncharacterized protein LOC109585637 [Amphimedon queenslandica]|uniref:ATPase dynein-related AAA domain-containing protein n=1 Tax=Amphimedon queenslandica TaxID=400682 RepID=A0AAN0JJX9_AMPQE|nr:PREDICTED: uncharacterized protein LOC109585637 [Amphimedon queenslandica]|eukprot:XP_019857334.1 PREDICTED: uncharacterized protein LOC109585637 [Amphimedon queenslandica]